MRRATLLRLLGPSLLGATLVHCGGDDPTGDCDAGTPGCPCLMNACFAGSMCVAGTCAPASATDPTPSDPTDDPPDPTSGTSAADTADATTTAATTDPPPASCGDALLDPGEDCDDGNAVPDDACSAACTLNTPRLELVDEMPGTEQGAPDGEPFTERCSGLVAVGLGNVDDFDRMYAVSANCKTPRIVPAAEGHALKFAATPDLPWHGETTAIVAADECGPASVPIGYHVLLEGSQVTGYWLVCAPVVLDGETLKFYQESVQDPVGTGTTTTQSMCPDGWIVTGHYGHVGSRVNGFGPLCARPVLTF